jgi:hypothetical protein
MDAVLLIVTGLAVLAGTLLSGPIPNWRKKEERVRTFGFGLTFIGGILSLVMGIRSAAQNETLMVRTARILTNSGTTLDKVNEALGTSKDVLKDTQSNLDKTQKTLRIASATSANVKEASSFVTGGDTFPIVFAHSVTQEDGRRQIGFTFQKNGKYPLYGLSVSVNKPYRLASDNSPSIRAIGIKPSVPTSLRPF